MLLVTSGDCLSVTPGIFLDSQVHHSNLVLHGFLPMSVSSSLFFITTLRVDFRPTLRISSQDTNDIC